MTFCHVYFKSFQYIYCFIGKTLLKNIYLFGCVGLRTSQWLSSKESTYNAGAAGEVGLMSELGRSPGGGQGNPFQYSCLENPMDRGAWLATVHRIAESDMTEVT